MRRFQFALKKLLTKREEKLTLEVRETKNELDVSNTYIIHKLYVFY
jgi:hypothetical protein